LLTSTQIVTSLAQEDALHTVIYFRNHVQFWLTGSRHLPRSRSSAIQHTIHAIIQIQDRLSRKFKVWERLLRFASLRRDG
jgi:hypothetical protein